MAKVPFTKLYTKEDLGKVKTFTWNEQEIEVKQYLPIEEKLDIMGNLLETCLNDHTILNPLEISSNLDVLMVMHYTNISFTEIQKGKNAIVTYNILKEIGLIDSIKSYVPKSELLLLDSIYEILENSMKYLNSLPVLIDNIIEKGKNNQIDLQALKDEISNNEEVNNLIKMFINENSGDKLN